MNDAQQDFIVRRSENGHLVFANASFCEAFDVRREDVLGSIFQLPVITTEPQAMPSSQHRRFVELLRTPKGKRWIAGMSRKSATISAKRKSKALAATLRSNARRKRG